MDAMEWLWEKRLRKGLLTVVHPWETGADISPRFDDWYGLIDDFGPLSLNHHYDKLVKTVRYDEVGVAVNNPSFVVAPSEFNSIAADAARRLGALTSHRLWTTRAEALSENIDDQLWSEGEGLWIDRADEPLATDFRSNTVPTVGGVLGALGTGSADRARRALEQCVGEGRFSAPFGPRYLSKTDPAYLPDVYWRGPTWPQLNYLLITAAKGHGLSKIAEELANTTLRGVSRSNFAEYWNPETGQGRGAVPQSWATVAVAL
jgi:glycogen debranching enzyme